MTYIVTFEQGPIYGVGQLHGLRRFASFDEARDVQLAGARAGRTGRVVEVATLETVCAHGRTGFCMDSATPVERNAVNHLHNHAFNWALPYGRDRAERYASAYARKFYRDAAEHETTPGHTHDLFLELTKGDQDERLPMVSRPRR